MCILAGYNIFLIQLLDSIQLIDEGMGDYHFYSDETSDNRRGEAESVIILARLNKSDNRPYPNRLTMLSASY